MLDIHNINELREQLLTLAGRIETQGTRMFRLNQTTESHISDSIASELRRIVGQLPRKITAAEAFAKAAEGYLLASERRQR